MTPRLGGRLYQQYVVDAFSTIEQAWLWWFRTNQTTLWTELYNNIQQLVRRGHSESSNISKGFILPFGFVGSRRYMQQNFQDALAVCHCIGHHDIFLTITTNPLWDEDMQANVDNFVSAEITDPEVDPVGYAAVTEFLLHGPCGKEWPRSLCMKQFKCMRHFPKRYFKSITFDQSGFPIYRRRKAKITVKRGKVDLDNQWVVPYNRDLLVKYQCHINIEICAHARSLKYLFKYCLKGHDRATVQIRVWNRKLSVREGMDVYEDEINSYFDGRYICGCEAGYRVFRFSIHYRSLAVERLSFHFSGRKPCTFRASEPLAKVAFGQRKKRSQLEAYFALNTSNNNVVRFLFDEIPQHYVWNDVDRLWVPRKRGNQIGRLAYSHHISGKIWFLRLLLTKVRGATSFQSLRTVKGKVCANFLEACRDFGLLDDDNEWHQVLTQCFESGFPHQIRQLYVHIMVNFKAADLNAL
ncbi:uncharacterized protein LOC141702391 [Apium graveolens]|uniref:uncharacterized protein LOC141702391 n=1 Tax=Apium graveolens TaxID=4045 RepID=UPI003D7BEB84